MLKIEDFDDNLTGDESLSEAEKSSWYKRMKKGILTSTKDKKDAPEGLWAKCPSCIYICTVTDLKENKFVCPQCGAIENIIKHKIPILTSENSG